MRDIVVVDIKEGFTSVAVFSEGLQGGAPKGAATVRGSFLDPASGIPLKIKEHLDNLSPEPFAVVLLLPRPLFHIVPLVVPAKNEALLARMMAFEAPRHFPLPPEQMVWDYLPSGQVEGGYAVTVAGIKKADFEPYFNAAEEAGIEPDIVSVSSPAFLPEGLAEKRAVVDIQPEGFEMCLMDGPRPVYTRYVRLKPRIEENRFFAGGFFADDAAKTIADQVNAEVDHIRLVGGVESPEEYFNDLSFAGGGHLRRAVAERLSAKPAFAAGRIRLLPESGDGEEVMAHLALSASAAGTHKKGATFNCIPAKNRRLRHSVTKRWLKMASGAIAGLLVFWAATAYAVHWKALHDLKTELADLKKAAQKDEGVAVRIGEYQAEFDGFNRFAAQKSLTLDLLDGLTAALPKNTFLTEVEFRDCSIMVGGLSSDASSILGGFEGSPRFKNAHMLGAVQSTGKGERFRAGLECE